MQEKNTKLMKNHVEATSSRPNSRGITLIALIITIIVMLILVGVTVNVALNGGLFEVAKRAASETQIEADKEVLQSEVLAAYDVNAGTIDREKLKTNLEAAGWNEETEKIQTVYISPKNNKLTVNENLEIEYIGKFIEEPVTALEDDNNPLTIGAIEDLVDFAIAVNAGTTYEEETVTLLTSLDFDNTESYRNPNDTSYGDINGNDTVESIMTELTTGLGFKPIGSVDFVAEKLNSFSGTFNGNEKTISNLYINRPTEWTALLYLSGKATVQNVTLENPEIYGAYAAGIGFVYGVLETENDILTISNCHTSKGCIGEVNNNCISEYASGLILGVTNGNINITECTNSSTVSGDSYTAGCVNSMGCKQLTVEHCSNYGTLQAMSSVSGISITNDAAVIKDCKNYATINSKRKTYLWNTFKFG